jgi:hypothetical protein
MCCLRSLEGMRKGEPELDNKEKRAVKEWQGETSRKVTRDIKKFASVGGSVTFWCGSGSADPYP